MASDSPETRELVQKLAAGDERALEPLLLRHLPALRAYVRLNAGGRLRALESQSDLCQSVCREVLANVGRFQHDGEGAFRHWLFTTALRKIKTRQKYWLQDKRDTDRRANAGASEEHLFECYASICTPSQDAMAREELGRIEAAFEKLSGDHREVILLTRIVGLSHEEVAQRMGRTAGATRVLLFRALAQLSSALGAA